MAIIQPSRLYKLCSDEKRMQLILSFHQMFSAHLFRLVLLLKLSHYLVKLFRLLDYFVFSFIPFACLINQPTKHVKRFNAW